MFSFTNTHKPSCSIARMADTPAIYWLSIWLGYNRETNYVLGSEEIKV